MMYLPDNIKAEAKRIFRNNYPLFLESCRIFNPGTGGDCLTLGDYLADMMVGVNMTLDDYFDTNRVQFVGYDMEKLKTAFLEHTISSGNPPVSSKGIYSLIWVYIENLPDCERLWKEEAYHTFFEKTFAGFERELKLGETYGFRDAWIIKMQTLFPFLKLRDALMSSTSPNVLQTIHYAWQIIKDDSTDFEQDGIQHNINIWLGLARKF
ncbi:MAG: hypothetical protein ABIJ34_00095 [archaeon]